ncbi:MAG: asparagine synthase (glutamine-hydrolyzing) [Proteobacteria bacterium]|nr:asparagine synthase (glutamine-hydrolyzing) [Pseudomonadota bacterium]
MCGIAGIFAYHYAAPPVERAELRGIRDHMARRGPDGKGEWLAGNERVGLAHRRLAIIDLHERAAQPMTSDNEQLVISFNGEIYNYLQLRRELEAKGRRFSTDSDTEVLLQLYAEKGVAMLTELRGMFAFALWDARKQAVLLARDPYGIKPLYYADDGWTLRIASQVRALRASPRVSAQPEPAGIAGFYLFGHVPEPWTTWQEIRAVPAGCYLWADATGPAESVPYFSLARLWAEAESRAEAGRNAGGDVQQQVRAALLDSVKAHRVSDVPVGAFLSAGVDSGALIGLMAETAGQPVQTVTLAFDEYRGSANDEAELAAQVAQCYGTQHTTRRVTAKEFQDDLPNILTAMDQPSIDGINTWFVAKAAREQGLKVAITGLGGDELFGGYPSFRDIRHWNRMFGLAARMPGLGGLTRRLMTALPLPAKLSPKAAGLIEYGGSVAGAYLLRRGLFMPWELPALMGRELTQQGLRRLQPILHIESMLRDSSGPGPASAYGKIAVLESSLYMRNQLLRDADWAGMAHALEIRVPLVDTVLTRQLAPWLVDGDVNGKTLLGESPHPGLPDTVLRRPKTGFTTPIENWLENFGAVETRKKIGKRQKHEHWARHWARFLVQNMDSQDPCDEID